MQDQLTSNPAASAYYRFAARFYLLGIDPAATSTQIQHAYAIADAQATTPSQFLTEARDSILDPARRLLCELTYPLDSTAEQAKAFYAEVSGKTPMSGLLLAADQFSPLSKANFLVHLTGRQAPDLDLLVALVEAHAALEATAIFEILRGFRSRSGFAMPSLVEIRQGLQELLALHSEAVMAAYDRIHDAASPLLQCVHQVISNDDRYRVEALSGLLNAYRKSLGALNPGHDINAACEAVKQRPEDEPAIKQFETALVGLISLLAPLMLFDAHRKFRNDEVDNIVAGVRVLLEDLITHGNHDTARKIVMVCRDAFKLMPAVVGPFEEAANALQNLAFETRIRPLQDLVQNFGRQPDLLVAAIQKRGFGKSSAGPARALWHAFSKAVTETNTSEQHARPWMAIRGLAFQLDARPEFAAAATRMMADLLRSGESLPANPTVLDIIRDDIGKLKAKNGPAKVVRNRTASYAKAALFVTLVPVLMFSAFLAYRHLQSPSAPFSIAAPPATAMEEPEAIPPVSKGERFKRDFVRYCHFQEERLRVIKQHVRGPEDIQAFNMLANDYNSRCSNFYYLDEDLNIVTEEVKARKLILEAEATRILSTWPWHAASDSTSPARKD